MSAPTSEDGHFSCELSSTPLLASWEASTHPAQVKLVAYRAELAELAAPALAALEPPLALWFEPPGGVDTVLGYDLDNYLTPVVEGLGGHARFAYANAMRGLPGKPSRLGLAPAATAPPPADLRGRAEARTTVSAEKREWKEAIAAAVGRHESAESSRPIALDVSFRVSPERNWVNLWKPAIDALGGILGEGSRPWHPRDGRITDLTLRRTLDAEIGWDIYLDFRWGELTE
jgi:hypothetical protein